MKRAFTLVEMLVAMAVLSLLVVILVQVISLTGKAIGINSKSLDAAGQARLVFDRIGTDLAARPNRTDLPMTFNVAAGNDSFQFYSQVRGYVGDRKLSVVGYRIQSNYQLARGATGTFISTGGGANAQAIFGSNLALAPPPDADYEVLAPGVFRLEICYLLKTGALSDSPGSNPNDYSNVAAIVVALGVLDAASLSLASTAQLSTLVGDLQDTVEGSDPLSGWNAAIAAGLSGAPKPVIQNVHVYERTFYVP